MNISAAHLPRPLLAEQVGGGGLDESGHEEAAGVALVQHHEPVLEELPGQVPPQPPRRHARHEVHAVLGPHLQPITAQYPGFWLLY